MGHAPGDNPGTAEGAVLTVEFGLMGRPFMGLNGGPRFEFSEAVSLMVPCETRAEIDRLWAALIVDGDRKIECGWLKDRFGMAWQIVPTRMMEISRTGEPEGRERAFTAMMTMKRRHRRDRACLCGRGCHDLNAVPAVVASPWDGV